MKRVLVTGATGLIGQHSLSLLVERGYEVHAITSKDVKEMPSGVTWHQMDLLEIYKISDLFAYVKPSHLLHFAWHLPIQWATAGADPHFRWIQISLELFRCFREQGGVRAVTAGSCTEYNWNHGFFSENVTPLLANSYYGRAKASVFECSSAYMEEVGISNAWGRIFFVYGKYQHPDRLVPSVINSLLSKKPAPCTQGNQIRDFLFTEDIADAFVTLLDSDLAGAVNIASGNPISLRQLVNKIAQKLDGEDLVQFGALPTPVSEVPFIVADTRRLADELGWRPQHDLSSGLDETIKWWKQQPAK